MGRLAQTLGRIVTTYRRGRMNTNWEAEATFRLLFGKRASSASAADQNPKLRAQWLRKALERLEARVNELDTTERHRGMLLSELAAAKDAVTVAESPSWFLVYRLLRFGSRLLGYDFFKGALCHTATYWQTPSQNLNTEVFTGGDILQDYYDKQNAVAVRRQVVNYLKNEGLSDYRIALVMNITEYQVKKLRVHEQSEDSSNAA